MIEFEGIVLIPTGIIPSDIVTANPAPGDRASSGSDTAMLLTGSSGDAVLQEATGASEGEWIGAMLPTASSEPLATDAFLLADEDLVDPQAAEEGEDIVITGRYYDTRYEWDGGNGGSSGGYSGYSGSGDGGDGGTGATATPVAQHPQDCGTEDGAAVQVAKHVKGELAEGVAGPPNPLTTSSGKDWTKVEFGAVIVRNDDGTFGVLNDTIYSSDQPTYAAVPSGNGQPVQGIWHSHPLRDGADQRMIDCYPSSNDWIRLANIPGQTAAVSNPSLWITGPDGVTREFKLSERAYFESLGERMKNGDGLDGKERTESCG